MSDAPTPALSDADKLLAVCKAVWPGKPWEAADDSVQIISQDYIEERLWTESLDDLRRVLIALTPEQVESFEMEFAQESVDKDRSHDVLGCCQLYGALTAPTSTILDALYRAVCTQ